MNKILAALSTLIMLCIITSGCSFGRSSKSCSKSASSPCRWSSRSSHRHAAVETAANSYHDEVIALTMLYAKSGGSAEDFQQELSMIARNHGIVDWETNSETFESIGIGLKQCGISDKALNSQTFLKTKSFSEHHNQIINGYNSSEIVS